MTTTRPHFRKRSAPPWLLLSFAVFAACEKAAPPAKTAGAPAAAVPRALLAATPQLIAQRLGECDEVREEHGTLVVNTLAFEEKALAQSLAMPIAMQNELNDCQQLVLDSAGMPRSGAIVGLWVRADVGSVDSLLPRGVALAAITRVGPDYRPLGLTSSISCLFVRGDPRTHPDGTGWVAAIRPFARGGCTAAAFPDTIRSSLRVRRSTAKQLGIATVPPTGRWELAGANEYHVGIRCGIAWCDIGPGSLRAVKPVTGSCQGPPGGDAQKLYYGADPGKPSDLCGTITPDPALSSATEQDFKEWKAAATIKLDQPTNANDHAAADFYHKKYLLDATGAAVQTLYLKYDGGWHARLGTADSDTVKVNRVPLTGHDGIYARWKRTGDDQIWVQCSQGCCYISGFAAT